MFRNVKIINILIILIVTLLLNGCRFGPQKAVSPKQSFYIKLLGYQYVAAKSQKTYDEIYRKGVIAEWETNLPQGTKINIGVAKMQVSSLDDDAYMHTIKHTIQGRKFRCFISTEAISGGITFTVWENAQSPEILKQLKSIIKGKKQEIDGDDLLMEVYFMLSSSQSDDFLTHTDRLPLIYIKKFKWNEGKK